LLIALITIPLLRILASDGTQYDHSVRRKIALLLLLVVLPLYRIARTYRVFSQTVDEPGHIAAGFQWLTTPRYDFDAEHPPLARIAFGLDAALSHRAADTLLEYGDRYQRFLAGARAGNLPFFLLALAAVGLWTRRLFGNTAALISLALFGALPPILGHASLATTDMAAAATIALALFLFARWLAKPSWRNAILTAFACGLGLLSKFSFIVFFPIGAAVLVTTHLIAARGRIAAPLRRVVQVAAGVFVASIMVWSGYKFSTGSLNEARLKVFPPDLPPHAAAEYATYPGYDWVRLDLMERYYRYAGAAAAHRGRGVDFVDWAKAAGYPSPLAGRSGDTLADAPPVPRPALTDRLLEPARASWQRIATRYPIPAPLFFAGLEMVKRHSSAGHIGFLLGEFRDHGWWYYFPVILFFKTPLAFLIFALIGIVQTVSARNAEAIAVALAPIAMLCR
jgi:4-amino-4-deoxy-L-arabinose transferase-like glycosyltransferase